MTPHKRGFYSLSLLPAIHLSRTLEGLHELTECPSRAHNLTSYVASQGHLYKDCRHYTGDPIRVCRTRLGSL